MPKPKSKKSTNSKLVKKLEQTIINNPPPHLIVEARAGTGKTTTLIEGIKELKGICSKLIPSPQQRAIWDSICLSPQNSTVGFVAFNKSIVEELKKRIPPDCDALTMHSLGYRACQQALGRLEPNEFVTSDHIAEILHTDIRTLRKERSTLVRAVIELTGLCKVNLSDSDPISLKKLVDHHEVELKDDKGNYEKEIFELVPVVIQRCLNPKGRIDFNDMIWLPTAMGLPIPQYDLLLLDEAQDLNRAQQALAKRAGRRLILCGDPKQAIYGFAGADTAGMDRLRKELSDCITLPLNVTRRCGRAIVKEANEIVKEFEAHETCPEGLIKQAKYTHYKDEKGDRIERPYEQTYMPLVKPGDMILCRCNGPLISQCFKFIKRGIKANIQGREIGKGLINLARKFGSDETPITQFISELGDWLDKEISKENAKKNPSEGKIILLNDRWECLMCFTDGTSNIGDIVRKIESVFTDEKDVRSIRLSSIHRAKGLEAHRVFLLEPDGVTVPHPMAKSDWQIEQEWNLRYVAITRAIEELVYVN